MSGIPLPGSPDGIFGSGLQYLGAGFALRKFPLAGGGIPPPGSPGAGFSTGSLLGSGIFPIFALRKFLLDGERDSPARHPRFSTLSPAGIAGERNFPCGGVAEAGFSLSNRGVSESSLAFQRSCGSLHREGRRSPGSGIPPPGFGAGFALQKFPLAGHRGAGFSTGSPAGVNPDNYVAGRLRADRCPSPAEVPIHTGSRLYLTRNVRKADDFLNGMGCTVLSHSTESQILWVRTDTGKRLPITPWHDPEFAGLVYYPIRLGYCSTVAKVQGDEFPFIIAYLDAANLPAVGYTALSRVKDAQSYLLGGRLTPEHFTPVTLR